MAFQNIPKAFKLIRLYNDAGGGEGRNERRRWREGDLEVGYTKAYQANNEQASSATEIEPVKSNTYSKL